MGHWVIGSIFVGAVFLSGCSQTSETSTPITANIIRNAKVIPISVAQALAADAQSQGISLSAQATPNTYTITAVDFYGSPLVYINITAPEAIKDPWSFAATLDGKEWPEATPSNWGITITGATKLSAPVSMVETGLGSLRDFYKTVQNMGGPSQLKRIVAALSTVFLLEDKNGAYWDPTTQARLDAETLEYAKKRYDELIKNISVDGYADAMAQEWKLSGANVDTVASYVQSDGNLNVTAYAARLKPTAITYKYTGSFSNPEYGRTDTVLGWNGGAQYTYLYGRSGQWKIGNCDGFGIYNREAIGCGPAAFSALLDFHFWHKGRTIMFLNKTKHTRTQFLQTISQPQSAGQGVPLLAHYMGTCWFGGGAATSAHGLTSGMEKFVKNNAPGFYVRASWSRGLWIPGNVGPKLDILLFTRDHKIPALIEYPAGGGQIHFSIARRFKAREAGWGLYVTPENHPSISVNVGDSLNGETGVFTIRH